MQVLNKRLESKTLNNLLENQLTKNYSLSKVESKVLAKDIIDIVDSLDSSYLKPGQMVYSAVSAKEGASKSIKECSQVKVLLTLSSKEDLKHKRIEDLRKSRVLRLSKEAFSQGALLTQEDLSALLCVETRTIRRDIAYLKKQGYSVPTRGMVKDIGKGTTHKSQAVRLFLKGKQFSEITRELYHSPSSILRYLRTFILVASLKEEGLTSRQILSMNLASDSLIKEYLSLYEHNLKKNKAGLKEIMKRTNQKRGQNLWIKT